MSGGQIVDAAHELANQQLATSERLRLGESAPGVGGIRIPKSTQKRIRNLRADEVEGEQKLRVAKQWLMSQYAPLLSRVTAIVAHANGVSA